MTLTVPKWLVIVIAVAFTVLNYGEARDGLKTLIADISALTQEARHE